MATCIRCGHFESEHEPDGEWCQVVGCGCSTFRDEPTDDELMNRSGVEGGVGYGTPDATDTYTAWLDHQKAKGNR